MTAGAATLTPGPARWRGALPLAPVVVFLLLTFVVPVATILLLAVWTPGSGPDAAPLRRLCTGGSKRPHTPAGMAGRPETTRSEARL